MAIPGLSMGNRARVYERMVDQLITDPALASVVKTWTTGLGKTGSHVLPNAMTATHIRLTPELGAVDWYSPDSHLGDLIVKVDILAAGATVGARAGAIDMVDVLNLWEAIENAFYPIGDAEKMRKFQQDLRDCGSESGRILFAQPAYLNGIDDATGNPIASGRMKIDVLRILNP